MIGNDLFEGDDPKSSNSKRCKKSAARIVRDALDNLAMKKEADYGRMCNETDTDQEDDDEQPQKRKMYNAFRIPGKPQNGSGDSKLLKRMKKSNGVYKREGRARRTDFVGVV